MVEALMISPINRIIINILFNLFTVLLGLLWQAPVLYPLAHVHSTMSNDLTARGEASPYITFNYSILKKLKRKLVFISFLGYAPEDVYDGSCYHDHHNCGNCEQCCSNHVWGRNHANRGSFDKRFASDCNIIDRYLGHDG